MAIIRKDKIGLFVDAGHIARRSAPSYFDEGDEVDVHHFSGTTVVGVGKTEECKRGEYLEYWTTSGTLSHEYSTKSIRAMKKDWKSSSEFASEVIEDVQNGNKILPCPFCRADANLFFNPKRQKYHVSCLNPDAEHALDRYDKSAKEAIDRWNQRSRENPHDRRRG